jgi:hypothetical protein
VDEIAAILSDAAELPRRWPSVYISVTKVEDGQANGVGSSYDLYTKGWLPYTLWWHLTVTEPVTNSGFALTASADFDGNDVWTFEQLGPIARITCDWRIKAEKALLRHLTWLLQSIFAANHRWAMSKGRKASQLELRRRHATAGDDSIAAPPPPTCRLIANN